VPAEPFYVAAAEEYLRFAAQTLDRYPFHSHRSANIWETVAFVALWCASTDGQSAPMQSHARRIRRRIGVLMAPPGGKRLRIDPSLRVSLVFADWLQRDGAPRRSFDRPLRPLQRSIDRMWHDLRGADTADGNNALLMCNALGATRMLGRMRGHTQPVPRHTVTRFAEHWRARYAPPPRAGRYIGDDAQNAVYFATHYVYAFTLWGLECVTGVAALQPEYAFISQLVGRAALIAEVGLDPATEVLTCAVVLGIPVPNRRRLCATIMRGWRRIIAGNNPRNRHLLLHVAGNMLFALRDCPAAVEQVVVDATDSDRGDTVFVASSSDSDA